MAINDPVGNTQLYLGQNFSEVQREWQFVERGPAAYIPLGGPCAGSTGLGQQRAAGSGRRGLFRARTSRPIGVELSSLGGLVRVVGDAHSLAAGPRAILLAAAALRCREPPP